MNFTAHCEQRMIERRISRREVTETLANAKASQVRESWKSPGTFMVFGKNQLVVVVDRRANILTTYRE